MDTGRPIIEIVIPVEKLSNQLDRSIILLDKYTTNYSLNIDLDSSINVAEARDKIMRNSKSRYLCFLDYDTEMYDPQWLDLMYKALVSKEAAICFCNEYLSVISP